MLLIYLKVNPDHDCCYIAFGGEEIIKEEYDVSIKFLCIPIYNPIIYLTIYMEKYFYDNNF